MEHPTIDQAYQELSVPAFAVWIRLMTCTNKILTGGVQKLAKVLGYSGAGTHKILRELYYKNYISLIKGDKSGVPIQIIIHKRAVISGRNSFIRLSPSVTLRDNRSGSSLGHHSYNSSMDCPEENSGTESDDKPLTRKELLAKGKRKFVTSGRKEKPYYPPGGEDDESPLPRTPSPKTSNNITEVASQHSVQSSIDSKKRERDSSSKSKSKFSSKMAEKQRKIKKKESEERKKRRRKKVPIKFGKLDSKGEPSVSFKPTSKINKEMMEILERDAKDIDRKRVMVKLENEFSRIYTRYMLMLDKSKGNKPHYRMPPDSKKKYCGKVALQCLYHRITPRQLLEYWNGHMSNFADGNLSYPTLSFLSGPFAAEQVAAALYEDTKGGRDSWHPGDFDKSNERKKKDASHSFWDTSQLDERLRPGLIKAGLDVRTLDDRYLLTVQKTALSIAHGKNIFVGGKLRDMVKWAVENLYRESEE